MIVVVRQAISRQLSAISRQLSAIRAVGHHLSASEGRRWRLMNYLIDFFG